MSFEKQAMINDYVKTKLNKITGHIQKLSL